MTLDAARRTTLATASRLTVQRLIQQHGPEYLRSHPNLSARKAGVLKELAACRTGAFGLHVQECAACGYQESRPNSCRNRHCPTCGGAARAQWLDQRLPELLPTSYFQVVFTLPHELLALCLTQPAVLYPLLFRTAWQTLRELAADPRYLGAELGALAVLHTWNQELQPHPHVHFVLPCGGLSPDGSRWIPFRVWRDAPRRDSRRRAACHHPASPTYFFPYQVLSRLFRGKFLAALTAAYRSGQLLRETLPERWRKPTDFRQRTHELRQAEWVVYQEAPPPGLPPAALVKYLARYVSGMAIADQRLVSCEQRRVTFTVKNRAAAGRPEPRQLDVAEFLSRFLQHVLPPGLTRIRYFGFWSTRNAAKRERGRQLLLRSNNTTGEPAAPAAVAPSPTPLEPAAPADTLPVKHRTCPCCQKSRFALIFATLISNWRIRCAPLWTPETASPSPLWPSPRPELLPASLPSWRPSPAHSASAGEEPPRKIRRDTS